MAAWGLVLILLCGVSAQAGPVSADQAQSAVTAWLAADTEPLGAKLGRQVMSVQKYADPTGVAAYYVVSLYPSGFVIASADDLIEPIIAFAGEGAYDPSPNNPLGALASNDAFSRVAAAREAQVADAFVPNGEMAQANAKWRRLLGETGSPTVNLVTSVSDVRVAPFVTSKWNQQADRGCGSTTYNYYTPSGYPSGCVATAMAQLMRYWQYPTSGVGSKHYSITICAGSSQTQFLLGGDGSGGPYAWANMTLDPVCPSLAARQAIGALCFDCGVAVGMDYCSDGSGADTLKAASAFKTTFGYSNAKTGYYSGNSIPTTNLNLMLNPNLHARNPVILGITGAVGGHAIVCDGYGYESATLYHHLNLGWAGSNDAWYNLPNITSNPSFTTVYKCIYNVYTSGTGELIAGRVLDFSGAPISGATVSATGGYSATTDDRGIYAIKLPASRAYTVSVTKSGYAFNSQSVGTGASSDNSITCGNKWPIDFTSTTPPPVSLSAAKLLANGASVAVASQVVSAVFGTTDYLHDPAGPKGIRVDVPSPVAGIAVGSIADAFGVMRTSVDGERYIEGTITLRSGSAVVRPYGLANGSLGGANWQFTAGTGAGQQGIEGAFGTNNIGMLVRAWGVLGLAAGVYSLDDSSADGVRLAFPTGYVPPAPGSFVSYTGIATCYKDAGGKLRRMLKVVQ